MAPKSSGQVSWFAVATGACLGGLVLLALAVDPVPPVGLPVAWGVDPMVLIAWVVVFVAAVLVGALRGRSLHD